MFSLAFLVRPFTAPAFRRMTTYAAPNVCLTNGLTSKGQPVVNIDQLSTVLEQFNTAAPNVRSIILNRPKALHALDDNMISAIYHRLHQFETNPDVKCVIFRSHGTDGRAFCAGGDVRLLYNIGKERGYAHMDSFFRSEYSMNSLIASLNNVTVLSILDGIVMGGGVGLSLYGKYRVATENTVFAMPECVIGLHPDVGTSFHLSRMPDAYGVYLGLTGARLKGKDVVTAGIATHYVPSESIPLLLGTIDMAADADDGLIAKTLRRFEHTVDSSVGLPGRDVVKDVFSLDTVEDIHDALRKSAADPSQEKRGFAAAALKALENGSPTALKVSFESIKRARSLSLGECLQKDFRLTARCSREPDFFAGVDAALVSKHRSPKWEPAELTSVTEEQVEKFFAPLDTDLKIAELDLNHWKNKVEESPPARM